MPHPCRLNTLPIAAGESRLLPRGTQEQWAACLAGKDEAPTTENPTSIGGHQVASQEVIVLAEPEQKSLGEERAALVESEGTQWLITEEGRVALPDSSSTEGRVVRRAKCGYYRPRPAPTVPRQPKLRRQSRR